MVWANELGEERCNFDMLRDGGTPCFHRLRSEFHSSVIRRSGSALRRLPSTGARPSHSARPLILSAPAARTPT